MTTSILLTAPSGEYRTPLDITYSKERTIVSLCLVCEGKKLIGKGCDALAFIDLQKQLPAGASLKCCLACRHGNMCPYSSGIEIYCTRNTVITSKEDVCDLFDREMTANAIEDRHHDPYDYCEHFLPQSENYYAYNDFWEYTYG